MPSVDTSKWNESKSTHESYAQLSFSRNQRSSGVHLYGSSIEHINTITMRICRSELQRDLSREWYFGGEQLIEVEMSQAQFAEAITSMNCGDGVPVTLTRFQGKITERCPFEDQRNKFAEDFRTDCEEGTQAINDALEKVEALFVSGKALNKSEKSQVIELLHKAQKSYQDSIPFLSKQFNQAMDKTTTQAKSEIEAFTQNRIISLAQGEILKNPNALIGGQAVSVPCIGTTETDTLDG